ncbi:MAG: division/cell wall cluster transcriptional repressor MraZ [Pirellulaceae bacterium]|nr:division/cell wall cluster transcriptional repressor MraZ [Planctomycetales bacterium]
MPPSQLILGEYSRTLDERHRLSIPSEMAELLVADDGLCVLAKQRPGALSLWSRTRWGNQIDAAVEIVNCKLATHRLENRIPQLQEFGRLLSTRHSEVSLAGRSRLVIPESFRGFLGVEPGGDVVLVGASVCIELWNPAQWLQYQHEKMDNFDTLLDLLVS